MIPVCSQQPAAEQQRPAPPRPRGGRMWNWQHRYAPYLFVSPFVVLFCVFMLWPLGRSILLSLHKTAGPRTHRWMGLGNYGFLIQDRLFWLAVLNTLAYAAAFLLLQIPASLGLALLLDRRNLRGRHLFRFAFFSPYLVGHVFVAVIFLLLLARNGPANQFLMGLLGTSEGLGWTTDPLAARLAVIIAALWLSLGYGMIYFLAALQSVDRELYDAAEVDGAGAWSRFWHVTLPGIKPVLVFLILVGTIGALQLFELPYVMFQGGGPQRAGMTVVMYLFLAFESGDIGYASAVGWALVALILGVTLAQVRLMRAARED